MAMVTEAFGGSGGIAQFNRDFLSALKKTGLFSTIDVHPRLGKERSRSCPATILQRSSLHQKHLYAARAVASSLTTRPDIVLSGHLYHGPLARQIARQRHAKLISVLHGTEIWGTVAEAHLAPLRQSDLVICVSEDTKDRCLAHIGLETSSKVVVLHNTFEKRFRPVDRREARRQFGLNEQRVVVTVGRLDDRKGYKGHDKIIPVIADLRKEGRDVSYLIAGSGPDRQRLQDLAASLDIDDLVRFLGHVPDDDLPALYSAADVFAMPSSGEGFGIVFVEAMACGTPAIGLAVGGAGEALEGLGAAVTEEAFPEALKRLVVNGGQNREALAAATRTRFGQDIFQQSVNEFVGELFLR